MNNITAWTGLTLNSPVDAVMLFIHDVIMMLMKTEDRSEWKAVIWHAGQPSDQGVELS